MPVAPLADEPLSAFSEMDDLAVARTLKLMQLRETRLEFATKHHVNTRGKPMDFKRFPHIRELYESLAPVIVIQGSVQCFKSEWTVIDHLAASKIGLSVFFVLPKFEHRNTYVQNRVDRCIQNVPEYKRILKNGFFDNVAMKAFGDGVIKYVGSNVMADFTEFPGDVLYVEEVDQCDKKNVEFALDRLRSSDYQFRRYIGNPDVIEKGISEKFEMSDKRVWCQPCQKCGKKSEMDWFKTVVESVADDDGNVVSYNLRDKDWEIGCGRDIYIMCPEEGCDGVIDRESQEGVWIPTNPESNIVGYHFSMLCAPINSISGMWQRFSKALSDPGLLKQFFNSDLGLPFAAAGNKVTSGLLDRCAQEETFRFVINQNEGYVANKKHPGPCSMGVDVGSNLDVRISFPEANGVRRAVYVGKVKGIDEVHRLIEDFNVEKCVIDSMPEVSLVQEFQLAATCDVWLCRYHKTEGVDKKLTYDGIHRIILVDRTTALDRSFAGMRRKKVILPANFRSILGGEFVKEMVGPVRELVEDASGNPKFEWSKCQDHQRHADTYDMLAADMMRDTIIETIMVG